MHACACADNGGEKTNVLIVSVWLPIAIDLALRSNRQRRVDVLRVCQVAILQGASASRSHVLLCIHCGVEVTESSTNKQHTLSFGTYCSGRDNCFLKTLFGGFTSLLKTQLRGGCVGGWVFEDSRDAEVEDQAPAASLVSQVVPKLHVAAPLACACRDSMLGADSVSSRAQERGKGLNQGALVAPE
jgi:hypothetical protein